MIQKNEEFYLLALQSIDGLGPIKSNLLLSGFTKASEIFQTSPKELRTRWKGLGEKVIQQIIDMSSFQKAEKELEFCSKNGIDIVSTQSENYPARLKHLPDKPLVLFKKGNIFPKIKKTLAIVGTRKSTDYGHRYLERFFDELKELKDICVISGLALGIDQKAHSLSVKHNIPTLAVMGLGLGTIYPSQNTNLAKEILSKGGGWMTETSSQDKTAQGVFPRRNRLIAGLCDALLVIETDIKGGSVITAQLANDYNKDVFALPGRFSDAQSKGCNNLIQKNIASLVNLPTDLIETMSWNTSSNKKTPQSIEIDFEGSAAQKKILETIRVHPQIELENLLAKTELEHSQLVENVLELELEGLISTLPGNKYELI